MKKKLLVAAVMAAMSLSAASAFAAPVFSGDANIEYNKFESGDSLTNRIRLVVDSTITDNLYVHGRVVMNNDKDQFSSAAGKNPKIELEQAYIGGNYHGIDIKAGRQPLFLGKGLLADVNGINGIQAGTSFDGIKLNGFYGKDGTEKVSAADFGSSFGDIHFGASYLKKEEAKFFGVNADTKIADNAVLNVEYAKNNDTKANGFLAEVKMGNAVKKGEIDYALSYRNIEGGAIDGDYTTNGSYNDSKGFRVKANYKLADNAALTAYQDLVDDQNGVKKNRTNVEFSVNF